MLPSLFVCVLIGCRSTKNAAPSINIDDYLIAWNEDTVNCYQVALKKNKFLYSITTKNGLKDTTIHYKGTLNYLSDTIYMKFTSKQPDAIAPYLVKEALDNYLIQYFIDGRKRMYLRIQRRILF